MASPHASSFLCLPISEEDDDNSTGKAYRMYFYVCLGSASIGALGAVSFFFQLLCGDVKKMITKTQKNVLINLAISDFLADLGVITRSLYYLFYWQKHYVDETDFSNIIEAAAGGAMIESWVAFWYIASYFWTFFFAVDIYSSKHNGKWNVCCSHLVTWCYCLILVGLSLAALWACKPYLECTTDPFCVISHFLCTFGPIILFMIVIPLFYGSILRKMERTFREGLIIEVKRREKEQAKKKVLVFILVFYICWLVNALDGVLLIVSHILKHCSNAKLYNILYKQQYIYSVWIIEAVLNPLQGLLNALAYGNICETLMNCYRSVKTRIENSARFSSWSGEYIDVDFREGTRGKISTTSRKVTRSE